MPESVDGVNKGLKFVALIPARYESTRLAGKVLLRASGKYLIEHTCERLRSAKGISDIIIAADDERVIDACREFNAKAVMTSKEHQSGTDRIAEAARSISADVIINVQADEPELDPEHIETLANLMAENSDAEMGTLLSELTTAEEIANPNIVKCVTDSRGYAIYFSRAAIPYCRKSGGIGQCEYYNRHIGIYAYKAAFLQQFAAMGPGRLEQIEKLEQLRALENNCKIITAKVKHSTEGIDTPRQYEAFVRRIKAQKANNNS
jgi:3-deoxy-manno-octulosonate cytidylyltransferase (CMP-KDO synthetase)